MRMTTQQIVEAMAPAISRAVEAAIQRHGGKMPKTLERAALIASEEAGELAAAVLDATRETILSREQYVELEQRIINENMDLLAAAVIFVMVNSECVPVAADLEGGPVGFEVDPNMKVM